MSERAKSDTGRQGKASKGKQRQTKASKSKQMKAKAKQSQKNNERKYCIVFGRSPTNKTNKKSERKKRLPPPPPPPPHQPTTTVHVFRNGIFTLRSLAPPPHPNPLPLNPDNPWHKTVYHTHPVPLPPRPHSVLTRLLPLARRRTSGASTRAVRLLGDRLCAERGLPTPSTLSTLSTLSTAVRRLSAVPVGLRRRAVGDSIEPLLPPRLVRGGRVAPSATPSTFERKKKSTRARACVREFVQWGRTDGQTEAKGTRERERWRHGRGEMMFHQFSTY